MILNIILNDTKYNIKDIINVLNNIKNSIKYF